MAAVQLRNIQKSFDGAPPVVRGIDLDIADGEFMVFVGPSGCGKTTLLRMIAGLESIDDGELVIGGRHANALPPAERGVAMVFQSYALYPHMTVGENMGFALKLAGAGCAEVAAAVGRAAEILQISHLLERKPKALSGGQRQRVAIGRAIVRKPAVFLFDEPLSNLDAALRVQMRIELEKLHQELRTTMVYVTHDQVEAMTMGDRIALFNQGRIEQVGRPLALYREPANRFVGAFLGSPQMNFIPARLEADAGARLGAWIGPGLRIETPVGAGLVPGEEATVGIRPEDFELDVRGGWGLPVTVDLVEQLGDAAIVYGLLEGTPHTLTAKLAQLPPGIARGSRLGLRPRPGAVHLFDAEGRSAGPAAI